MGNEFIITPTLGNHLEETVGAYEFVPYAPTGSLAVIVSFVSMSLCYFGAKISKIVQLSKNTVSFLPQLF